MRSSCDCERGPESVDVLLSALHPRFVGGMASLGVSARQKLQTSPKFMLPVTVDALAPHPLIPFQPDASQVLLQPTSSKALGAPLFTEEHASPKPRNILAAARCGDLEWVRRYAETGQTDMADNMGEVSFCAKTRHHSCSQLTT